MKLPSKNRDGYRDQVCDVGVSLQDTRSVREVHVLECPLGPGGDMAAGVSHGRSLDVDGHYVAPAQCRNRKSARVEISLVLKLLLPYLWRWSLGARLVKMM